MRDLPADVLLLILDNITLKTDLLSLSTTSKTLNALVTPRIYRSITIPTWTYKQRHVTQFVQCVAAGAGRHLGFTRSLTFQDAIPPPEPRSQMPALRTLDGYSEHDHDRLHLQHFIVEGEDTEEPDVDTALFLILQMFPDHCLESFIYISRRPTSLPLVMHIHTHQTSLRQLKSNWGFNAAQWPMLGRVVPLLKILRTLDIHMSTPEAFASLLSLLSLEDKIQLERLSLSLREHSWSHNLSGRDFDKPEELRQASQSATALVHLKHLSLTNFDLKTLFTPLSALADFNALVSLTLSNCRGTNRFLPDWTTAREDKRMCLDHLSVDAEDETSLKNFLAASPVSLQSLHVYVDHYFDEDDINNAVAREMARVLSNEADSSLLSQVSKIGNSLRNFSIHLADTENFGVIISPKSLIHLCESCPELEQLGIVVEAEWLEPEKWTEGNGLPTFQFFDLLQCLGTVPKLRTLHLHFPTMAHEVVEFHEDDQSIALTFKAQRFANALFQFLEISSFCPELRALVLNLGSESELRHRHVPRHCYIKGHSTDAWNRTTAVGLPVPVNVLRQLEPVSDILDYDPDWRRNWPGPEI